MYPLGAIYESASTGQFAAHRPDHCGCGGRGWFLSDLDTWHKCPLHYLPVRGVYPPHPEDIHPWHFMSEKERAEAGLTEPPEPPFDSQRHHMLLRTAYLREALEDLERTRHRLGLNYDEWLPRFQEGACEAVSAGPGTPFYDAVDEMHSEWSYGLVVASQLQHDGPPWATQ